MNRRTALASTAAVAMLALPSPARARDPHMDWWAEHETLREEMRALVEVIEQKQEEYGVYIFAPKDSSAMPHADWIVNFRSEEGTLHPQVAKRFHYESDIDRFFNSRGFENGGMEDAERLKSELRRAKEACKAKMDECGLSAMGDRYGEIESRMGKLCELLCNTPANTFDGARALVDMIYEYSGGEMGEGQWFKPALLRTLNNLEAVT